MELQPTQILTDSLCSLQLVRGWGTMSESRRLLCHDRAEVRGLLDAAALAARICLPVREKVRAHDELGVQLGAPKALGNDVVDGLAKRAAAGTTSPSVRAPAAEPLLGKYGDPVVLLAADGTVVSDVVQSFHRAWWRRCWTRPARRPRPRLDALFAAGLSYDWKASVGVFRRPRV